LLKFAKYNSCGIRKKKAKPTELPKVLNPIDVAEVCSTQYTQIVELREDKGLSYAKIASELGCSKSTVSKYLKMWKVKIPVAEVKPSGRPKKVTDGVKRQIRTIITKNQCISSSGISEKLKKKGSSSEPVDVSGRTVRRALKEMWVMSSLGPRKFIGC